MRAAKLKKIRYPGFRSIKTALSIILCVYTYQILGRDGAMMAAFAAVICMQDSVEKTIQFGLHRVLGTALGGAFGILFVSVAIFHMNQAAWMFSIFIGVVGIIYICNLLHQNDCIVIGIVVFIVIVLDSNLDTPVLYAVDRVLDTLAGIVIALLVNRSFFRPDRRKLAGGEGMLHHDVRTPDQYKISRWSGGSTSELYIHPRNALYEDRDFKWRLSSATVETEESVFSPLEGYLRHIMVLEGEMQLEHEGHHAVYLKPYQTDYFHGDWRTVSRGQCVDFNLILQKGMKGMLDSVRHGQPVPLVRQIKDCGQMFDTTGFYCLTEAEITVQEKDVQLFQRTMHPGELLLFHDLKALIDQDIQIVWQSPEGKADEVLAVRADLGQDQCQVISSEASASV